MNIQTLTIAAIGSLALTACFDKTPVESAHTVSWFLKHNKDLNITLQMCSDNPAKYRKDPNCINALRCCKSKKSAGELHPIDWH